MRATARPPGRRDRGGTRHSWRGPKDEAGGDVKSAAGADLALDPDLAAHHTGQLLSDRQAQAGAAILPRRRAVRLNKGLKHRRQLVGRDADA